MSTRSTRVNANVRHRDGGGLECAHCGHELAGGPADYLSLLPRYEAPVSTAGPQVFAGDRVFVDSDIVFRQYVCPGCGTAFHTEVTPVGESYVPR